MAKKGLHDGFASRKWWALLLCLALVMWAATHLTLEVLTIVVGAIVGLYSIFSGFNVAEKMMGTGGLLNMLGVNKGPKEPEDPEAG